MNNTAVRKMQTKAETALKKAVKKAIARHKLAGVPAVIWRNGKISFISARKLKRA